MPPPPATYSIDSGGGGEVRCWHEGQRLDGRAADAPLRFAVETLLEDIAAQVTAICVHTEHVVTFGSCDHVFAVDGKGVLDGLHRLSRKRFARVMREAGQGLSEPAQGAAYHVS